MARTRSSIWVVEYRTTDKGKWMVLYCYVTRKSAIASLGEWHNRLGFVLRVWRYEAVPDRRPERKGA